MCKVLMIAGIKKDHQEKVKQVLEVASKILSRTEEDGVGYAAITDQGVVFGEKWLNKDDAFKIHEQPKPDFSQLYMESLLDDAAEFEDTKKIEGQVYGRFGQLTKSNVENTVAVMLHTRKKTTGEKSIVNTHPFFIQENEQNPDTALIHNGSILNHEQLTKTMSTCDSETLLHEYLNNQMSYNPWGITQLAHTVKGEYTVGVLSSSLDKNDIIPHLDIFKSNKDLYSAYCVELETAIFSTMKWNLEEIAKECGLTLKNVAKVKDGYLIRLNAITGERIEKLIPFEPSSKTMMYYADNRDKHHGPNTRKVSEADIEDTIDSAKEKFEMNHADLFLHQYKVPAKLSKEEQDFLTEIENSDRVNLKALRLVQHAMGIKLSS